jgi:hypothetical protein
MESRVPDDMTIRDYLLGRLERDSEVVERIDHLMLTDPEFSENCGVIEDEILEEYLEGTLSAADRGAVESHFLQPPERQRKLQHARLLSRRLAESARQPEAARQPKPTRLSDRDRVLEIKPSPASVATRRPRSNFRLYAEIAAAVLLTASVIYLSRSRVELKSSLGESAAQLTQEREHSAQLNQQLQAARGLAQPSTAMLSLFQPGVLRGSNESLPNLTIGPATTKVRIELALLSSNPRPYNLRLESQGKTLWSLDHLTPFTSPDGAILIFEIPVTAVVSGENRVQVSQSSEPPTSYFFTVSR